MASIYNFDNFNLVEMHASRRKKLLIFFQIIIIAVIKL